MLLYSLKMAWWNTALSPAVGNLTKGDNKEHYATICEHIKNIITKLSCDLIAICEVSTDDVAYITSYLGKHLTNLKVLGKMRISPRCEIIAVQ
jgi:hypothetical protein